MDPKEKNDQNPKSNAVRDGRGDVGGQKKMPACRPPQTETMRRCWWMLRTGGCYGHTLFAKKTRMRQQEKIRRSGAQNAMTLGRSAHRYREGIYDNKCLMPTKMRGPHRMAGCQEENTLTLRSPMQSTANNPSRKLRNA
jgi:hypothetical protein